ncbi:MAG: GNAT family N-acetyltransferase [Polaromonas sp.]|nr:GNAT family N-acetyltransferase [Polaromonas sp.]
MTPAPHTAAPGTGPAIRLRQASFPEDTAPLLALIREYLDWLNVDACARRADRELAELETLFTPPSGLFLMAHVDGALAGCAGLLRHTGTTAELKRVYVRPAHRGLGLGEQLVRQLMALAPTLGANRLILDAVPPTLFAQGLYRRLGFTETPPYYPDPAEGTRFFEFHLPKDAPCLW